MRTRIPTPDPMRTWMTFTAVMAFALAAELLVLAGVILINAGPLMDAAGCCPVTTLLGKLFLWATGVVCIFHALSAGNFGTRVVEFARKSSKGSALRCR